MSKAERSVVGTSKFRLMYCNLSLFRVKIISFNGFDITRMFRVIINLQRPNIEESCKCFGCEDLNPILLKIQYL